VGVLADSTPDQTLSLGVVQIDDQGWPQVAQSRYRRSRSDLPTSSVPSRVLAVVAAINSAIQFTVMQPAGAEQCRQQLLIFLNRFGCFLGFRRRLFAA